MKYILCTSIQTVEEHQHFGCPFVCGISLAPAREEAIALFSATRAHAQAISEAEAAEALAGIVREGVGELSAFRQELACRVDALAALVADARKIASLPADLAGDRAIIAGYIVEAEGVFAAPAPVIRDAEAVARWAGRFQGDGSRIVAAVKSMSGELNKIADLRRSAATARDALRAALMEVDSPEAGQRIAGLKLQRDIARRLPSLVEDFAAAEKQAASAVARMGEISAQLRSLAGLEA